MSRPIADWDAIRTVYEQGGVSNRELARRYAPLTEGAVRKRAKKEHWARPERARVARPAPIIRRAERPSWHSWIHPERTAARRIIVHRDRTKPSGRSLEEMVDRCESAVAALLHQYRTTLENRELLIEMLEQYAEEFHIPYRIYLKLGKQFELLPLSLGMRNLAEILKILASTREKLADSAHRKR